jgi:Lrp/AsnC family leucine-responsive transcriptional regulator
MDAIDLDVVRLLERHGRLSQEQLARRVRLSRPAVHQRVRRLEAAGVLKGATGRCSDLSSMHHRCCRAGW